MNWFGHGYVCVALRLREGAFRGANNQPNVKSEAIPATSPVKLQASNQVPKLAARTQQCRC